MPRASKFIRGFRRHPRLLAAVAVLAAYLLLMFPLGCGGMLADRLMLFPSRDPIRAFGTTEHFVESPAGRIHVIVAQSGASAGSEPVQTGAEIYAQRAASAAEPPQRSVLRIEGHGGRAEY